MPVKIQRMIAIMTTICLLVGISAMAEADDPVVVRVGDFTYAKRQVKSALDSDISLYAVLGDAEETDEDLAARKEATINRFVAAGVIQCKLAEEGKNDFTAEEESDLKAAARNQYEQMWQSLYQRAQQSGEDFTEAQITEFMEDEGYTIDAIYEEYKASERRYRAIELFCPAITLTPEMIEDYYRTQYLEPDRERYEGDLDLYEQEILAQQNESFYTPEGYRAIQQILIEYPEEVTRALRDQQAAVNTAGQALADALQALAAAATTAEGWDDMMKPRAAYDEALQALQDEKTAYDEQRKEMTLPIIKDTVAEIEAAFDAGIDFNSLIDKYSADKNAQNTQKGGYPVHPDSKNWPEDFLKAVADLEKPGAISKPVLTDLGIHILYYASDIPAGEHELTAEERETLDSSAMNYYQSLELDKLVDGWRDQYEIETHPELLDD